jgi:hypothetical protein
MNVVPQDPMARMYVQPVAVSPVPGSLTVSPVKPADPSSGSEMRSDEDRRPRDPQRKVDIRV